MNHKHRIGGVCRSALVAVAALMVPLAIASPALAAEHHPTGNFAPFKYCPLGNPAVTQCIIAETKSGTFTVGKKTVPITNTITLQGGTIPVKESSEVTFVGAENAETLSKTPQTVPGGLLGINCSEIKGEGHLEKEARKLCEEVVKNKLNAVTETTELAKPPSAIKLNTENLIFERGVALQLPVKVKLSNVFLGSKCYIGSEAEPITLNLTTGETSPPPPNKPIHGAAGELEILEEGALLRLIGGSLVDNAFAAPGANGCGGVLAPVVDPLVDALLGVPAAAGENTAILNGNLEDAAAAAVRASE
jgi:hypothetical protein